MEMRPWAFSVLLALAVLASGRGEELSPAELGEGTGGVERLGESSGAGQEGIQLMPAMAAPESDGNGEEYSHVGAGKKALDSYEAIQSGLTKRADELRDLYDHPPVPAPGITYTHIPGMVMRRKGTLVEQQSRVKCETVCNTYSSCQSYSYNEKLSECIWAMEGFEYDVNSVFYLKTRSLNGALTLNYEAIPGLVAHTTRGTKGHTGEECKYECSKSAECSGYSYRPSRQTCTTTTKSFIEFSEDWDYYEKDPQFRRVPKEKSVETALNEAATKKHAVMRQASRMRSMRREQSQKAEKARVSLRKKGISAESQFKQEETKNLNTKAKFDKADMVRQVSSIKVRTDTTMLEHLVSQKTKLDERLKLARGVAAAAGSKEAKEKADIDVQYLETKTISSRHQAKQMKTEVVKGKAQEAVAKRKFKVVAQKMRVSNEALADVRDDLEYLQANVDVADKEKDTKIGLANIADLKDQLELATLERPFREDKVEVIKEKLAKENRKQQGRVTLQKKFQQSVQDIKNRNRKKYELNAKKVQTKLAASKKKREHEQANKKQAQKKEAAEKATQQAIEEKHAKDALENLNKQQKRQLEKARADKVAEQQRKQLAKEEAVKANLRLKKEQEQANKDSERAIQIAKEREDKKQKQEQGEKEVRKKYEDLKKFKAALELSEKHEEKAKEEKHKANQRMEKDEKEQAKEQQINMIRQRGYLKTKEIRSKKDKEVSAKLVKKAKEKLKKQQEAKANSQCASQCQAQATVKESAPVPSLVGCFKDNKEDPALSDMISAFDVNSVQWCNTQCARKSPSNVYFGLQNNECWCGTKKDKYDAYGEVHPDKCILECPGNPSQLCGGPQVNRVYEIVLPQGIYKWSGHVKNESRPVIGMNYNFEYNECQCYGTLTNSTLLA
jgi:hypothetical protein